ncbi:MAG: hypothetical protein AAB906_01350 [Patescibacteria group bacterium]
MEEKKHKNNFIIFLAISGSFFLLIALFLYSADQFENTISIIFAASGLILLLLSARWLIRRAYYHGRKKRVGVFSLTCDEGCSIYLTEIFNKKLLEWLEKVEWVYFLSIKDKTEIKDLDVALIEGVVTSQKDKEDLEKIRANSKTVIAMGTCAVTTVPSGQRNRFNAKQLAEIKGHMEEYHFLPKALALKDVVKVDDQIMGCPIDEKKFVEVFEKYLK